MDSILKQALNKITDVIKYPLPNKDMVNEIKEIGKEYKEIAKEFIDTITGSGQ